MAAIHIDHEQFHQMIQGETPVLVDFWAPWCSYCRRIGPAYDRIAEEYGGRIAVTKLNIDESPHVAEAEQIEVIPTLVLYRSGQVIDSIVAPESKPMIGWFLEDALAKEPM